MAGARTDDHGKTSVFGLRQLLAAREECIQIHVGDPALCLSRACHA
jgi:hypothetical protein